MKTLNVPLMGTLLALSLIACPLLYFYVGPALDAVQLDVLKTLLLVVLFQGSAAFAEEISSAKYPEYQQYCRQVSRFFPGKRYDPAAR